MGKTMHIQCTCFFQNDQGLQAIEPSRHVACPIISLSSTVLDVQIKPCQNVFQNVKQCTSTNIMNFIITAPNFFNVKIFINYPQAERKLLTNRDITCFIHGDRKIFVLPHLLQLPLQNVVGKHVKYFISDVRRDPLPVVSNQP
eukprot:GGOE01048622.1.p1 GENE.GGOE01048622.1~~GGOE01048622.1.p1  ORF type:complete len:143 (-),score=8.32 GGOE01048622.1:9-437(-)